MMKEQLEKQIDENHEAYKMRRDELLKIKESSAQSHDNTLLQLSLGGLAIVTAFIDKIGPAGTILLMGLSWITFACLAGVAIFILVSFVKARKNTEFLLLDLDKRYGKQCEDPTKAIENQSKSVWENRTTRCNNWALGCLIAAILSFSIYAGVVQFQRFQDKGAIVTEQMKPKQVRLDEGEIPAAQAIAKPKASEIPVTIPKPSEKLKQKDEQ